MKNLLLILSAIVLFTGCKNDEDFNESIANSSLIGTWQEIVAQGSDNDDREYLIFTSNYRITQYTLNGATGVKDYTYEDAPYYLTARTIHIRHDGMEEKKFELTDGYLYYYFTGSTADDYMIFAKMPAVN